MNFIRFIFIFFSKFNFTSKSLFKKFELKTLVLHTGQSQNAGIFKQSHLSQNRILRSFLSIRTVTPLSLDRYHARHFEHENFSAISFQGRQIVPCPRCTEDYHPICAVSLAGKHQSFTNYCFMLLANCDLKEERKQENYNFLYR